MMQPTQNRVATRRILALGLLLAALVASLMLAAKPAHASTTFTVNSTEDHADANLAVGACDTGYTVTGAGGGQVAECTLRAAMEQANYSSGADTINFNISGSGVQTIAPATELPTITEALTINGYSQPGAQPNTKAVGSDAVLKIELNGPGGGHGLFITASNSTVKGLVINRSGEGIRISGSGATGNKVVGSYLGTDPSGTQKLGNGDYGVAIGEAPGNTIGGTTPGARNVISGNLSGIGIDGASATGNRVTGNYIGTGRNGITDLGNSSDGVFIDDAPNNTIGGTTAGERNVISGNDADGVLIEGIGASGNKILGNYVGTDATGTKDLGNGDVGVSIDGSNNVVGGTEAGARNVISGNDGDGVYIYGAAAAGNEVLGNYLGTDASGAKDLGNGFHGVLIIEAPNNIVGGTTAGARNVISGNDREGVQISGDGATGNELLGNYVGTDKLGTAPLGNSTDGVEFNGASGNTIGGTQAGARNLISGNGSDGVEVTGDGATGNRILSNSIYANAALGIDLEGNEGPTANDPGDADTGPNNLQNFPVISSAKTGALKTTVNARLDSAPNTTFTVQFFSNPSGTDEGKRYIGQVRVTTNGSGDASFSFSPASKVAAGQTITATATGPGGNTSEFSAPRTVVAG